MPVPSQGNSAGSLDVVEAQVARKCGMQRLRGQAAPRLLSPVCISLAESNVHSSAKARPPARRIWDQPIQSPRTTRLCHRGPINGRQRREPYTDRTSITPPLSSSSNSSPIFSATRLDALLSGWMIATR